MKQIFIYTIILLASFASAFHQMPAGTSTSQDGVIEEKLGKKVDLSLIFTTQFSQKIPLKNYLTSKSSNLILTLNYFSCPTMCTFQYSNLLNDLKSIPPRILKDTVILSISFDPRDKVKDALEKYKMWSQELRKTHPQVKWDFLLGDPKDVQKLTQSLNFYYSYSPEDKQYSHTTALFFINAQHVFMRYLYGMVYDKDQVKFAIIETTGGEVGNLWEKFKLKFLVKYSPERGKYL